MPIFPENPESESSEESVELPIIPQHTHDIPPHTHTIGESQKGETGPAQQIVQDSI